MKHLLTGVLLAGALIGGSAILPRAGDASATPSPMLAEDVVLWTSQTFTGPFTNNIIGASAEIPNPNALNSVKVTMQYEAITPDGANSLVGFTIQAILEEEAAPDVWIPVAYQFDEIKGTDEAKQQVIELTPGFIRDPGNHVAIFGGAFPISSISREDGVAPGNMRVRLYENVFNPEREQLTAVTVSGYLRKFNR